MEEEIIRLRNEIRAIRRAGNDLNLLILSAHDIIAKHLPKPGSDKAAFNELIGLMDSPRQRKVQEQWTKAIS